MRLMGAISLSLLLLATTLSPQIVINLLAQAPSQHTHSYTKTTTTIIIIKIIDLCYTWTCHKYSDNYILTSASENISKSVVSTANGQEQTQQQYSPHVKCIITILRTLHVRVKYKLKMDILMKHRASAVAAVFRFSPLRFTHRLLYLFTFFFCSEPHRQLLHFLRLVPLSIPKAVSTYYSMICSEPQITCSHIAADGEKKGTRKLAGGSLLQSIIN